MVISIIAVLFTFGLVIFLHEFGHFLVCKLVKIKVEAFSFGFGPELFGRTSGATRYSVRAIPLGGYVKPAGENIEEATGAPDEYFSKPWYSRLGIVFAGPAMNYILAFALFAGVIITVGEPVPSNEPVIGDIGLGYPAEAAGLKAGDRILSVDGKPVAAWDRMAELIHARVAKETVIEYRRGTETSTVKIKTVKGPQAQGIIGISQGIAYIRVGLIKSGKMAAYQCWFWTALTVKTLASNIYHREKPDISGPIGIVNIVSKAAHNGLSDLIFLIGVISVAVGFFNLLPIPLLDGGHAFLYVLEGLTKKKITPKIMQVVNSVGIAIIVGIFVFATYNDINRMITSRQLRKAAAASAPSQP
ncbi:MAG: M50 family metallopeptidase [Elusimicrobia bacterium]|nr:M50 family metallopeptidase [Elusimicrobiota bacterium]